MTPLIPLFWRAVRCHGYPERSIHHSDAGRGFYLAVGGAIAQHVQSHIEDAMAKHRWRVSLIDHTDDMAMISVQGPNR